MQSVLALRYPLLPPLAQNTNNPPAPTTPLTNDSVESRTSYFSQCSPRTAVKQAPSLSDGRLSPSCLTLGSDSSHQSDVSDDDQSINSSRYLTPPEARSETDLPPHRPRSQTSDSLTMAWPKTSTRSRSRKESRARRRRPHKCGKHRERIREMERRPYWWLPGCRITTSAPPGFTDSQEEYVVQDIIPRKSIQVTIDRHDGFEPQSLSLPVPPVMTRRWSSALTGTQQFQYEAPRPKLKGKTWSNTARRDSVVETIRQKLTNRKVSTTELETPASITLRRASGVQGFQGGTNLSTVRNSSSIDSTSRRNENDVASLDRSTYLITSQDIETITQLVRANISSTAKEPQEYKLQLPKLKEISEVKSTCPSQSNTHRNPSATKKGFCPRPSIPADVAVTVADLPLIRHVTFLPGETLPRRESSAVKVFSKRSVHEIIWEDRSSGSRSSSITPLSERSMSTNNRDWEDHMSLPPALQHDVPQSMTSHTICSDDLPSPGDPFSSQVFHWEWKETETLCEPMPPLDPDISFPVSARGKINEGGSGEEDNSPEQNMITSDQTFNDVISFPALPHRKSTKDWISSPPNIAAIMTMPSTSALKQEQGRERVRSMYGAGIDAFGSISLPAPMIKSVPETPQTEIRDFDFQVIQEQSDVQQSCPSNPKSRKGTIIRHPRDNARVGKLSKPGHAIGSSSGARRKSSTRTTRIRFESLNDEDLDDRKPWKKPRKDSGYPLKRSNSASPDNVGSQRNGLGAGLERRASRSCELLVSAIGRFAKQALEHDRQDDERWKDRERIILESSPKLSAEDRAGIYSNLTGALEGNQREEHGVDCGGENTCVRRDFAYLDNEGAPRSPSVDWIG